MASTNPGAALLAKEAPLVTASSTANQLAVGNFNPSTGLSSSNSPVYSSPQAKSSPLSPIGPTTSSGFNFSSSLGTPLAPQLPYSPYANYGPTPVSSSANTSPSQQSYTNMVKSNASSNPTISSVPLPGYIKGYDSNNNYAPVYVPAGKYVPGISPTPGPNQTTSSPTLTTPTTSTTPTTPTLNPLDPSDLYNTLYNQSGISSAQTNYQNLVGQVNNVESEISNVNQQVLAQIQATGGTPTAGEVASLEANQAAPLYSQLNSLTGQENTAQLGLNNAQQQFQNLLGAYTFQTPQSAAALQNQSQLSLEEQEKAQGLGTYYQKPVTAAQYDALVKDLESGGYSPAQATYYATQELASAGFSLPSGASSTPGVVNSQTGTGDVTFGTGTSAETYNIGAYNPTSTDPGGTQYASQISQAASQFSQYTQTNSIDSYIQSVTGQSTNPITGDMLTTAAQDSNVPASAIAGVLQHETQFGTLGEGATSDNNPGGITYSDSFAKNNPGVTQGSARPEGGYYAAFPSMQAGVTAVGNVIGQYAIPTPDNTSPGTSLTGPITKTNVNAFQTYFENLITDPTQNILGPDGFISKEDWSKLMNLWTSFSGEEGTPTEFKTLFGKYANTKDPNYVYEGIPAKNTQPFLSAIGSLIGKL